MGLLLKQSTAVDFLAGPFIDDTDGKTPETGLTVTSAEVRLSKNGGNMAAKNEATSLVHDELGMYTCKLDTTDTNTLGTLQVTIWESGALMVYHEFMVVPANTYDSLVSGSDVLTADVTQIGGVAQSATDLKDFADAGYDPAAHKVAGVVLTDLTTACTTTTTTTNLTTNNDKTGYALSAAGVDAVWDENMGGHIGVNTAGYELQLVANMVSTVSQAQGGAAGTITLAAGASAVNDFYKGQTVCLISGTGAGQARAIYAYDGGTKVASIRPNWATQPIATTYYAILNVGSSVVAYQEDAVTDQIWDEVMDANAPANCNSARETINVIAAASAGKLSGGGTVNRVFRDLGDTKARITAVVDANYNRTASTVDGT